MESSRRSKFLVNSKERLGDFLRCICTPLETSNGAAYVAGHHLAIRTRLRLLTSLARHILPAKDEMPELKVVGVVWVGLKLRR